MAGIIYCEYHGRQITFHSCNHVFNAIKNEKPVNINPVPLLVLNVCDTCNQLVMNHNIPLLSFNEALKLPEKEIGIIEQELEIVERQITRCGICTACFKVYQDKMKPS